MKNLANLIPAFLAIFFFSSCNNPTGSGNIPQKTVPPGGVEAFSDAVNISDNTVGSKFPAIAVDGAGNIYVVWIDFTSEGDVSISFIHSSDKGASWSKAENISNITVDKTDNWIIYSTPAIAADSAGNCYAAWVDSPPGDSRDIYFSRLAKNSDSWSKIKNISNHSDESYSPDIAVDSSGNINAAWLEYNGNPRLRFSRSTNNGADWSKAVTIDNDDQDYGMLNPAFAIDSAGNINIAWSKVLCYFSLHIGEDIFFSRSENNGGSWETAVNITNGWEDQIESYYPDIVVDSAGDIFVVWCNNWDILFSRSTDNGSLWSEAVKISSALGQRKRSINPRAVVDGSGTIYVVWQDYNPGNYDIFFSFSKDSGHNWSDPVNISNSSENSAYPAMAVDGAGNIYIVWHDYTGDSSDIFFSQSVIY